MRPSRLRIGFPGGHQDMNLLMNLDLLAAVEKNGWTAYASIGREPPDSAVRDGRTLSDPAFISYEHWISYQTDQGFAIRAGRFMPAYGYGWPITRRTRRTTSISIATTRSTASRSATPLALRWYR